MSKRTDQTKASLAERISGIAQEVLQMMPYFLVDVEVRGHWGTRVVEVYVDGEGECGLDDLAEISREIEFVLDVEDVVDGSYKLEVSSPGADRPLGHPLQYRKNVGRRLRVEHGSSSSSSDKTEGTLIDADETGIKLADESRDEDRFISYQHIREARVVLPW